MTFSNDAAIPCSPCEQTPAVDASGFSCSYFTQNIKDLHNYIFDPVTRNRRIETQAVSYLFSIQAFPSSESLSRLSRFVI